MSWVLHCFLDIKSEETLNFKFFFFFNYSERSVLVHSVSIPAFLFPFEGSGDLCIVNLVDQVLCLRVDLCESHRKSRSCDLSLSKSDFNTEVVNHRCRRSQGIKGDHHRGSIPGPFFSIRIRALHHLYRVLCGRQLTMTTPTLIMITTIRPQ